MMGISIDVERAGLSKVVGQAGKGCDGMERGRSVRAHAEPRRDPFMWKG